MNFWILLIFIGMLSTLTQGHLRKRQVESKKKILNQSICSAPVRIATPTVKRGFNVTRGYYPWHTAIFKVDLIKSEYICGGTLISSETVLTAAHCLYDREELLAARSVVVRFDVTQLNVDGTAHFISNIITHENFNEDSFQHDIALLKLQTKVRFTNYIRPACITNENFNIFNVIGHIAGFGESTQLMEAGMPGRTYEECKTNNKKFYDNYVNPDYNFCAGNVNGTTISKGDSGGAIVFVISNTFFVRGIASLAASNSRSVIDFTKYALFTDVQSHYKWIVDRLDMSEINESVDEICTGDPIGPPLNSEFNKGQYPWNVAIYNDEEISAGTIINPNIILTDSSVAKMNYLSVETHGQLFRVKEFRTYNNDEESICLMKLNGNIVYNQNVQPACVTKMDFNFIDHPIWIPIATRIDNKIILKDVQIMKSELFNYSNNKTSDESISYINKGTGLVVKYKNGNYLSGFTTFPYTHSGTVSERNISPFYDWIVQTINELN